MANPDIATMPLATELSRRVPLDGRGLNAVSSDSRGE